MSMLKDFGAFINRIINVEATNPDDARRKRLLNIILVGMLVVAVLTLALAFISSFFGAVVRPTLYVLGIIFAVCTLIFYSLNRSQRIPAWVAASLFILFMMTLFAFVDSPKEMVDGRSLFIFSLPVIIASVLLQPISSFIFSFLVAVELIFIALSNGLAPNIPALTGFFMIALVSWLSARSLEDALRNLRTINAELDQRVANRTAELSDALTREHAEASRRQAILQGIADGVIVLDNDGLVIMSNLATSRLLEIPIEQIVQRNIDEVLRSPMLSDEDRNILLQTIGTADVTMAPMRIRWDKRTLSVKAAPVRDVAGRAIGNVAVLRDFTREAEVEEMKNTFVAMVSHELRTPLNAILGYSEMLRDAIYGAVNDKQANAADRILKNSRRLLDIVSDLLDKAQIEAGHLALSYEKFKTADMVDSMHSVMDKIAGDKGLELKSVIAPEMPEMLHSDPQRLQQVLVNLVNNAVKFTEKGGITVRVYRVTDEHWAFDVTDTGPGIAIEDQKYIFDPFRQVEGTTTRAHGGIGLGLAIVSRIIDLMGGRIFVQSALGQGTTFTVILPFEPRIRRSDR